MKKILSATSLTALALSGAAQADVSKTIGRATQITGSTGDISPSPTHRGQWWTHPAGCEYSRTGRPGETVWYLIINTARPGCPAYIAVNGFKDIY